MEECDAEGSSFEQGVRAGVFTVPGDGDIDFGPIFQALADAGFEGWLVVEAEQDPAMAHPLTHALKAREYIREKTGI
jgi:inosose dehydratase